MSLLEAGINATQILPPNPNTPMAFLPPDYARKFTIQIYGTVGSLAMLIWDILVHLPLDFELGMKYKVNMSFIIYVISRITTLAYILGVVILGTIPIGDCGYIRKISYIYPFTTPITLLLFLLRTSALYKNNKCVVGILSLSWLGVAICSALVPMGVTGNPIADTGYCIEVKTPLAWGFSRIAPFIHDTFVFMATSFALMKNSYSYDNKSKLEAMVFGKYLPAFSKSLLRDGQAYYLATLIFNITSIMAYTLPFKTVTPCAFGAPLSVMIHTMSCYVYRNVRLGVYKDTSISSSFIDRQLQESGGQKRMVAMGFTSFHSSPRSLSDRGNDSQSGVSEPDVEKQIL